MFSSMEILPKTEIKKILRQLEKQFDFKEKLDYLWVRNPKGKIFVISKDFEKINLELQKLREMNLLELYEQFYSELEKLSSPKDKDWELSLQIAERILTDLFKKKNRAHHQHRK